MNYYVEESFNLNFTKDNKNELFKESNINISSFKKESLNKVDAFNYFRNYFFFIFVHLIFEQGKLNNLDKFFDFLTVIQNYDNYTKIRLLAGFINIIKNYKIIPILIDIRNLEKDNPYNLAIDLQKNIISNLNEKSNIFYPILQFNSKILRILPDNYFTFLKEKFKKCFNKNISQNYAYTMSLENIEEMKFHLMSIEENFFFAIGDINNYNFYGLYNKYCKITVINQYNLCKDIFSIQELNKKKDYAFSLNMVFSHERMCHGKEGLVLSIQGINSPCIFFNNDFKRDYICSSYSNNEGEAGRVLEKFVAHPLLIIALKENKIYGKFLNYKYFIKDFNEIKKEVLKTIKDDYFYKKVKNKKYYILKIEVSIYVLIFSLLLYLGRDYINHIFKVLLLVLISFGFLISIKKNYKIYRNPLEDNEIYYDIIKENINNDEKENRLLIYPDHYPMLSDTFIERYFPCLEYKKNKIRKKLSKYINGNGNYY